MIYYYLGGFCLLHLIAVVTGAVLDWRYVALDNTWHPGSNHKKMLVPQGYDDVQVCSTYCSLIESCDGFYVEEGSPVEGNCRIVDEDLEPGVIRMTDPARNSVYYVKVPLNEASRTASPGGIGARICDTDTFAIPTEGCQALFPDSEYINGQRHYSCSGYSYEQMSSLVQDRRCGNEDRMVACEIFAAHGTNFDNSLLPDLIDRTEFAPTGYKSFDHLENVKLTLKNPPAHISRLVLRAIDVDDTTKLEAADIIFTSKKTMIEQAIRVEPGRDYCVVMIRPELAGLMVDQVDEIEVRNMAWQGPKNGGFKLDIFTYEK